MGEWPQGGFRASLSLRARAAKALHAYRRAEARFHELQKQKDALDTEERVILHIWAVKLSKASIGPDDYEAFQSAYMSLGERRAKLFEPWQAANADLVLAYERAQHVLRDMRRCASPGEVVPEKVTFV
ncbi:hypothetical protein [Neorhizobium alkalisoli]|uniref:hypothetical protein n=1 Tax=Neorhizobium alkalisoli TaxID=528178 RepID=UPI000CF9E71A|nr:hypothetical protein [Neorhizobium alkalisoli]